MFILSRHETSLWPRIVWPLIAGLIFSAAYHSSSQAATVSTYVLSDEDGYGVLDCLTQNASCGKIVADAWCEAHGHGAAQSFGRAEDITASIGSAPARHVAQPGAAVVSCSE